MGAMDAEVDQPGEVLLIVIGRSRRALTQIGAHLDAALVQMAGADQPVAAIVARPDQDEHAWRGFSGSFRNGCCDSAARDLHHLGIGMAARVGGAFDGLHLGHGDQFGFVRN